MAGKLPDGSVSTARSTRDHTANRRLQLVEYLNPFHLSLSSHTHTNLYRTTPVGSVTSFNGRANTYLSPLVVGCINAPAIYGEEVH